MVKGGDIKLQLFFCPEKFFFGKRSVGHNEKNPSALCAGGARYKTLSISFSSTGYRKFDDRRLAFSEHL
jgi:hypothetical protein